MPQDSIFGPVFATIGLTFVVWVYMYVKRIAFINGNQISYTQTSNAGSPTSDGFVFSLADSGALGIGLVDGVHSFIVHDPEGSNGHFEIFNSPAHSPLRIASCYPWQ